MSEMATAEDLKLMQFCRSLPKIELHAHINACISTSTVRKLVRLKEAKGEPCLDVSKYFVTEHITLDELFQKFKIIHALNTSVESMFLTTYETIREMAADGVRYAELRSTPRADAATGMTKRSYVDAVLAAVRKCEQENVDIVVKLLLSIDRRGSVADAADTVRLATQYAASSGGVVVGVDLSGDPAVNDARVFIPVLREASAAGLKLSLHLAEVVNNEETLELLRCVRVDRIGHGVFLHPEVGGSQAIVDCVRSNRTPIECCLSSNEKCYSLPHLQDHHFVYWHIENKHPCIPCTDGGAIFETSLSREYYLLAEHYGLTRRQLYDISLRSIDHAFTDETTRDALRRRWQLEAPSL
ncbi:PREDICTED: adenosine deaminase-like protein [Priapulus caudatus]|uniref:Adenosine deaminase-like protein n=1 Tax=Priapulus caudatus TaxID=37621 RepID=A0ABM1EIB6_PRICU|nr:PREDICTED: adenosine deaminase-like protein [Priapulus caudatus]